MLYAPHQKDSLYHPPSQVDPTGFGKTAIVTGCASGIGLATTQLLLAHQFNVLGLDLVEFDYRMFFYFFSSLVFLLLWRWGVCPRVVVSFCCVCEGMSWLSR